MREELLKIVNKHLYPFRRERLFKHALPELQEFKQKILDKKLSDKELLIATHELCQKAWAHANTPDLEKELNTFLKDRIEGYFINDTTETFLKKCFYRNVLKEEPQPPAFRRQIYS